ncbi:ParA family protein, partial [Streptomyces sp. MB09-01]|nr:ParA family protein [Streptomyces sp. MB09-01]
VAEEGAFDACMAAAGEHISAAWGMDADCGPSGDIYKATVTLQIPVLYPGLNFGRITGTGGAAMEKE